MSPELNKFKEYLDDLLDEYDLSVESIVRDETETCYIFMNPGNYDSYIALDSSSVQYHIQMGNSGLYGGFDYENENDIFLKISEVIENIKKGDKRKE
jgi:hypothetical protein